MFVRNRHTELLRVGISSVTETKISEFRPEGCITMNAKWVLPWMWQRRNTDLEFVMLVTCEWMLALCGVGEELIDGHPVFEVMKRHGVLLLVFTVSLSRDGRRDKFTDCGAKRTFSNTSLRTTLYRVRRIQKQPKFASAGF